MDLRPFGVALMRSSYFGEQSRVCRSVRRILSRRLCFQSGENRLKAWWQRASGFFFLAGARRARLRGMTARELSCLTSVRKGADASSDENIVPSHVSSHRLCLHVTAVDGEIAARAPAPRLCFVPPLHSDTPCCEHGTCPVGVRFQRRRLHLHRLQRRRRQILAEQVRLQGGPGRPPRQDSLVLPP